MAFPTKCIDRAIIMTQYDLRGFLHPMGMRAEGSMRSKDFAATIDNFFVCAAGGGNYGGGIKDFAVLGVARSGFRDFNATVTACKKWAEKCDVYAKEAVKLIVAELICLHSDFTIEVEGGKREKSVYLKPLEIGNGQGNLLIALAKAFDVKLPQHVKAA